MIVDCGGQIADCRGQIAEVKTFTTEGTDERERRGGRYRGNVSTAIAW